MSDDDKHLVVLLNDQHIGDFNVVADEEPWIRNLDMTHTLIDGVATASKDRLRLLSPS